MTVYGDSNAWMWFLYIGDGQTIVGNTNVGNTTISGLDSAELALCAVGMTITGTDIPADTRITVVGGSNITISNAATGTTGDVTFTIQDVLYINCEDWNYDNSDPSVIALDYPSRGHFGFTLNTEKVMVKVKNTYVLTEAAWNILKAQIKVAQESDDIVLVIKISSTPSYEKFDGTSYNMPILIQVTRGRKKKFKGDATIYNIAQLVLIQADDLA